MVCQKWPRKDVRYWAAGGSDGSGSAGASAVRSCVVAKPQWSALEAALKYRAIACSRRVGEVNIFEMRAKGGVLIGGTSLVSSHLECNPMDVWHATVQTPEYLDFRGWEHRSSPFGQVAASCSATRAQTSASSTMPAGLQTFDPVVSVKDGHSHSSSR